MIEILKMCGISACAAALAGTIINLLSPGGNMEKVLNFCVSGFFICVVLYPFLSIKDIYFSKFEVVFETETESNSDNYGEAVKLLEKEQIEKVLNKLISQKLSENNLSENKILYFYNTDDSNCISISQIEIFISDISNSKIAVIEQKMKDEIGYNIKVVSEQKGE